MRATMCQQPRNILGVSAANLRATLGMSAAHHENQLVACLLRAPLRRVGDGHDVAPAPRVGGPGGDQRARVAAAAPVVRVSQEQRRADQRRRLRQQRLRQVWSPSGNMNANASVYVWTNASLLVSTTLPMKACLASGRHSSYLLSARMMVCLHQGHAVLLSPCELHAPLQRLVLMTERGMWKCAGVRCAPSAQSPRCPGPHSRTRAGCAGTPPVWRP